MADKYKTDTDFLKTLGRMYRDSKILYENGEYYNCCYLCGYVLECALKYILLTYERDENGEPFSAAGLKKAFSHNTQRLNTQLESCMDEINSIPASLRLDCRKKTPYMLTGREGQKPWNPELRYGGHPQWDEKEYCDHYMEESNYIFGFIANITL